MGTDGKWSRLNKKLIEFMETNDFFGLGTIYYEMADFLEKEDKNNDHLKRFGYYAKLQHQINELERLKRLGCKEVKILTDRESCVVCKKSNHRTLSLKEAEFLKTLPVEGCAHKY